MRNIFRGFSCYFLRRSLLKEGRNCKGFKYFQVVNLLTGLGCITLSNLLSGVNCRTFLGHHFGNTLFIVRLDMPAVLPLEVMTRLSYVRMMLLSIDSHQADLFVTQAPVKSPQPLSHTPVKKGVRINISILVTISIYALQLLWENVVLVNIVQSKLGVWPCRPSLTKSC